MRVRRVWRVKPGLVYIASLDGGLCTCYFLNINCYSLYKAKGRTDVPSRYGCVYGDGCF